ncbi:MAG: murein biosynthesis integral membrane protein MurJ [Candidatus Caenarcaniphilales bacterium]|nr:murein biosynthesis integral membrane protein MurJ [Candidatus Caenarcaniphilales bacterium]
MSSTSLSWFKSLFKTSFLIGLSKVAGFIRDLVIAAFFGTSKAADAFNFAYLFTGNIFILLGGLNGPFHSAVVTTLSHIQSGIAPDIAKRKQSRFLSKLFLIVLCFFCILAIALFFAKNSLLHLIIPNNDSLSSAVSKQVNFMIPVFIMSGIIGVLFGAVSFKKHYFWPSLSPLLTSVTLVCLIFIGYKSLGEWVLGIGTSLGALVQTVVQIIDFFNSEYKFDISNFKAEYDDLKYFVWILMPALLSSTIGSLNVYVDSFFCAGLEEGSWTAILMANRLIQLPFGILVGSSLVSFLPKIANLKEDKLSFISTLYRELINLLYLLIPATAIILALSKPLIELLFLRGEFDTHSSHLVNLALLGLAVSLITSLPREIYTRAFYAIGDSKTPFIVSLISIIWNALLDWILSAKFQVAGIAMSTTLTALINSLLLIFLFKQKFSFSFNFDWLKCIQYLFIGFACYLISSTSFQVLRSLQFLPSIKFSFIDINTTIRFLIAVVLGLFTYLAVTLCVRKMTKSEIMKN